MPRVVSVITGSVTSENLKSQGARLSSPFKRENAKILDVKNASGKQDFQGCGSICVAVKYL